MCGIVGVMDVVSCVMLLVLGVLGVVVFLFRHVGAVYWCPA